MENLYELIQKADGGDLQSQVEVAQYILYNMEPDEVDAALVERALAYLHNVAPTGFRSGWAADVLGDFYYRGKYVAQDYRKAILWHRTAILKGHPCSYHGLGVCYLKGHGVPQDYAKAFDSFFKGALTGYRNCYTALGDMCKHGEFVGSDLVYAAKLYHHVFDSEMNFFEKNNLYSDAYGQVCLRLGAIYLYGHGVGKNVNEANFYFSEAKKHTENAHWVKDEDPDLLRLMEHAPYASEDDDVRSDSSDDEETDFRLLMAERLPRYILRNCPEKELNALCALNPSIKKFDDEKFKDIFEGARAGDARQMYKMGTICYNGDANCPRNPALKEYGLQLFHESLFGGCADALEILGLCYYHGGDGVEQNYETALFLYRLSNEPMALGEIGVCFANGNGVERDDLTAYFCFVKCLLLDAKRGGSTYENLTVIYPRLKCFEQDQAFIDFCHIACKKYDSNDEDTF